jgi:hypothetical protein
VATAAEDRLSFRRNPHTPFVAASDCQIIGIYEYTFLNSPPLLEVVAEQFHDRPTFASSRTRELYAGAISRRWVGTGVSIVYR